MDHERDDQEEPRTADDVDELGAADEDLDEREDELDEDEEGGGDRYFGIGSNVVLGVIFGLLVVAIVVVGFLLYRSRTSHEVNATVSLGSASQNGGKCPVLPQGLTFSLTMTTAEQSVFGARSANIDQKGAECTMAFTFKVPNSTHYSTTLTTPPAGGGPTDWAGPTYTQDQLSGKGYTLALGPTDFSPAGSAPPGGGATTAPASPAPTPSPSTGKKSGK